MTKTISEEMIEHLLEEQYPVKRRGLSRPPRGLTKIAGMEELEMDPVAAAISAAFVRINKNPATRAGF